MPDFYLGVAMVHIVGSASTAFRRHPERDHRSLAEEALRGALAQAELPAFEGLAGVWFGACALHAWGQPNVGGQVTLAPLVGTLVPEGTPIVNVEAGCATGSAALNGAAHAISAGADLALAVGVEKTWIPQDPARSFALFAGGADVLRAEEWLEPVAAEAARHGLTFAPHPGRVVFLDLHALTAEHHMAAHGITAAQIAKVASKDHAHGALNDKAQYRKAMTVEQVLADKAVVGPLTRSMCAPISDGAAAVLLASDAWVRRHSAPSVRLRGMGLAGGRRRGLDAPSVTALAARKAWAASGVAPEDIQLAEVHDATSACALQHLEALGLCDHGASGALAERDHWSLGGDVPVNTSGGLVSKGHPLAATGLGMIDELCTQLRGRAGARQVQGARIAVAQNAGGSVGLDEALAAVTVLEG